MIIVTSPIRTWCRWCWTKRGSRNCTARCRNCRTTSAPVSCAITGCRPTMPPCWWPSRRRPIIFETVAKGRDAKQAANWIMGDLFSVLNRTGKTIEASPVSADVLGRLLDLIADSTISGRIAKEVFEAMVETGGDPAAIVDARGLRQVTDTDEIDAAVAKVLAANGDKVAQYRAGREKLFGFFVGQVMRAMGGKGNPALVNETLRNKLANQRR